MAAVHRDDIQSLAGLRSAHDLITLSLENDLQSLHSENKKQKIAADQYKEQLLGQHVKYQDLMNQLNTSRPVSPAAAEFTKTPLQTLEEVSPAPLSPPPSTRKRKFYEQLSCGTGEKLAAGVAHKYTSSSSHLPTTSPQGSSQRFAPCYILPALPLLFPQGTIVSERQVLQPSRRLTLTIIAAKCPQRQPYSRSRTAT